MNRTAIGTIQLMMAVLAISVGAAVAQLYDIDWHTVDGGGVMFSSGGDFELSGTIGQPDAGTMSGGAFALTGGFWFPSGGCSSTATCPDADVNCDNVVNGLDVAAISSSANFGLSAAEAAEPRADVNGDGTVNGLDVAAASSSACFGQ